MATYYVDPDWTGTKSGTQSEPWSVLNWATINSSLASEDVTVYFSAREAGSDTDEDYGAGIDIEGNKTADPGYTLTLDGYSYYNTNDSTPSWAAYSGSSMCIIEDVLAQNSSHTKYNDVTVRGFNIVKPTSGKAVAIAGDNWTIEDCDISHGGSVSDGPLVYVVPTADSGHEGSSAYTPACDNINILNNNIHDSYGELIYVGGGGSGYPDSGDGYPSHTNITITGNTIDGSGALGGQPDGIDIKGGIVGITISGNEILNINTAGCRPIVMQGVHAEGNQSAVIEKNYIHDCTNSDEGISLSNSWGDSEGVEIRNNIIDTINGEGIVVYSGSATSITILNNTIYNCGDEGIRVDSGNTVTVQNNALLDNNSGGAQNTANGTMTQSNNAHNGSWAGSATDNVSGLTAGAFVDASGGDFSLSSGSALIDVGYTLSSFADDYAGIDRPQGDSWDIGAYEYEIKAVGQMAVMF